MVFFFFFRMKSNTDKTKTDTVALSFVLSLLLETTNSIVAVGCVI